MPTPDRTESSVSTPGPDGSGGSGSVTYSFSWWVGELPARVLGVIACLALFAMMLLTFIDVMGRYLFSSPLPAAYELISLIMPAIIFCALPHVNLTNSHVTIDLLDSFIPAAVKRVQVALISFLATAILGLLAWRLRVLSQDHFEFDGVTDELYLPLWPFSAIMSGLCVVATISMFVTGLNHLSNRTTPQGSNTL